MKFKNLNLRAYRHNSLVTLSFDKKDDKLRCIVRKIKYIDTRHHSRIKIPHGLAENYKAIREIKEEIKQTEYKPDTTDGVRLLTDVIEEKIISRDYHTANKENWQDWMRVFAYEYLYDVAFNRGIRHERQRRKNKHKAMTAFDIISSEDVSELSNELGINEDRLTYAVLEVISKRKNGGTP